MKIINRFGITLTSFAVLAAFGGANAADNGRNSRSVMPQNVNTARMPTMPVVSLNTVGNPAVQNIDLSGNLSVSNNSIIPTPTPTPTPSDCPDGKVKDSDYTVSMCMNDVLQCINTGALQGGLNDMFNEDVRNAIMGGMKICQVNIDKCISDVRVNCRNVYSETTDVWLDFNSRIVQPEYYNFVLRKTGLTPNQAENTCLLLDRNTYGSSFAAVSDTNAVNTEYNIGVGAYNNAASGNLSKNNPQGVNVNTTGYDGNRGHYARWDASKAECLIRVAAYNKDKLITNSWLFGAVGNDAPAEIWEKAGSSFTCNKELFDFSSLLNDTKTAAVIGIGGGTILGAAIGAGAGAAVYEKKAKAAAEAEEELAGKDLNPCSDEEYLQKLSSQIAKSNQKFVLQTYLYDSVTLKKDSQGKTLAEVEDAASNKLFGPDTNWYKLNKKQCEAILDLYAKAELYKDAIAACRANGTNTRILGMVEKHNKSAYEELEIRTPYGDSLIMSGSIECGPAGDITQSEVDTFNRQCLFVPLQLGFVIEGAPNDPFCNHNGMCKTVSQISNELSRMTSLLNEISPAIPASVSTGKAKKLSKGKEIGKGLAIGAATGAAAGGLATAITAFVERSNITCRVGDGLNSVALGKSHTIDSLKDFYVKWNLHLPDAVSPTSAVSSRADWDQACSQFNGKLNDCPHVQINLKDAHGKITLVQSACVVSGSVCITNDSVATSNGF